MEVVINFDTELPLWFVQEGHALLQNLSFFSQFLWEKEIELLGLY